MRLVRVASVILFILIIQCNGVPRFANTLGNHMVLQRAPQRAVVWGFGDSSTVTTLTMNGKTYTTISGAQPANAQNESIWSVTLDPVSDEGPFDIHVSQPLANGTLVTITLRDVLFGDVWICSGQSNMQMTVGLIFNATEEMENAINYPKIRLYSPALFSAPAPIEEVIGIDLKWTLPSAETIGGKNWTYFSATCWLYGRMIHEALDSRPIGLIATSYGGTAIEYWMPPQALEECNSTTSENVAAELDHESFEMLTFNHTNLYNGMIYPFTRMVIYGVIWYQGEANRDYNSDKYACNFAKMIQYWRKIWNTRTNGTTDIQFPFGFVQLATYTDDSRIVGGFPWLRWHQTFDIGYAPNNVLPNLFMAVAVDLRDDPNGIHPRYKHDVGYRLSRAGLANAYGKQVEFQGPLVESVAYSTGSQTMNISYRAVSSIELRNPNGFEVCCQGNQCLNDTLWVPTTVSSKSDLTITLTVESSCVGKQLYGLRYLWRETPCPFKQAAIYSGTDANLPSPPFLKLF